MTNTDGSATSLRRLLALAGGVLAGIAVVRLLRRRRAVPERVADEGPDPRAEALRRKLAGTRDVPPDAPAGEPDPDAARRRVHDEAQGAIDEMRRSGDR